MVKMPTISTFEVIIPTASYGVAGFAPSRLSVAEAEAMLNQKLVPHPEIDHEALLSSLDSIGMRHYGGGLPVASVRTASPAEGAGLRVWDVIVKVGGIDVRKDGANGIVKELLKSKNGLSFTVLRSSKTPSGSVEALKKKKKSKLFGCFSFSSNIASEKAAGFAPEKNPTTYKQQPPMNRVPAEPYPQRRAFGGPVAYNIPNQGPMLSSPAPAPNLIPASACDVSVENVADFSMTIERYTDKENQLGQRGYMFDDNGPVFQPGVLTAY